MEIFSSRSSKTWNDCSTFTRNSNESQVNAQHWYDNGGEGGGNKTKQQPNPPKKNHQKKTEKPVNYFVI